MGLVIEHVTKRFDKMTAANDISLKLESGKMLGFLGGNGAGKTTTFRMILGLGEPVEGHITYNGKKLDKTMYNRTGYLPEERGLHGKLTVEEELKYLATLKGMSKAEIQQRILYWLKRFDITENRKKRVDSLSKGNRQKIQLLISMLYRPELSILDEPFSGLDPVNAELLKEAVKSLNDWGSTIVYSSHCMEHIEESCDDIRILDKGQLAVFGNINHARTSNGNEKVVIESETTLPDLTNIRGIIHNKNMKQGLQLTIENEDIAKDIYQVAAHQGYVKRFQVVEPSLQDILIERVSGKDA